MLAAPLLAGTDVVVTIDDAALGASLLLAATPVQPRQEQAGRFVYGGNRFERERYGFALEPEVGGGGG